MQIVDYQNWVRPGGETVSEVQSRVREMLAQIKANPEQAIREFSQKFDGFEPQVIELKPWTEYDLDEETKKHLKRAAERIESFANMQKSMFCDIQQEDEYGVYGQKVVALDSMAAYIPGGRFPLVSTALMTLIPARVAGVTRRIAVSPGDHPAIQAAASLAGATGFIRMGGAQAIAALAFGSSYSKKVDMIVGPGNAYVNAAKGLLQDQVKIDTLAGPSEILVLCDESIDPLWVAMDVLAQAEHDPMALSVLGSNSKDMLQKVATEIERISAKYPGKDKGIIQLVYCPDGAALESLADKMAAEHLHVACDPKTLDPHKLRHYGSLFIGPHAAVALGDYCSGPNHTLPTMGFARQKGGLQVGDFLKTLTWQEIKGKQYDDLANTAIHLATIEELDYHRLSLEVRLNQH